MTLKEKLQKAQLTEEEVALCFYRQIKNRVQLFIPLIGRFMTEYLCEIKVNKMKYKRTYSKLSKAIEMTFKITNLPTN